jgi:hypothetical protein
MALHGNIENAWKSRKKYGRMNIKEGISVNDKGALMLAA